MAFAEKKSNVTTEIQLITKNYYKVSPKDMRVLSLLLIDPLRAFLEKKIPVSQAASRHLRRCLSPNQKMGRILYEKVRDGKLTLPGIKKIRLVKSADQ
ncbi:MAG: hypothetical protein EPGJADBJ_05463 [Saprospiraceae bacterium]|nr:hypothetical protein [Saprospiraceae bacterium]